jgi:hypothetical protein
MANRRVASGLAVAVPLPHQLRQPRHVDGNPPRFVLRENLRLPCFVFVVERLPVGVTDDIDPEFLSALQAEGSGGCALGAAAVWMLRSCGAEDLRFPASHIPPQAGSGGLYCFAAVRCDLAPR